jgi:hypothetical protein
MKKIIILTILLILPSAVFAASDWKLKEAKNTLLVEGSCEGKEVTFEIYPQGKGEPAYTSNAACKEGKFIFKDNLLQWKSLVDGRYELVINGDQKNIKTVEIQRPVEVVPAANVNSNSTSNNAKNSETMTSPEVRFLGAFVSLQQATMDMRTWLADTSYPAIIKTMIGFSLDSLDTVVGKLSSLITSSESNDASMGAENSTTSESKASITELISKPEVISEKVKNTDTAAVDNVNSSEQIPVDAINSSTNTTEVPKENSVPQQVIENPSSN